MKSAVLLVAALAAAGCASSRAPGGDDDDDDDDIDAPATIDAADVDGPLVNDAADVDAPAQPIDAPAPPSAAVALAITEVSLAPTGGELIEILNPTASAVNLRDYYLSDVPTYYRLPAGDQSVAANDFIVRFPAGATIAPGGVITVAMDTGANFMTALGVMPTYSIAGATVEVVAASGAATLTNTGEPVVLFYWDGASDRITDIDIMIAGVPSAGNALVNKTGNVIDGPDADANGVAYAPDALTIAAQPSAPGNALSTKRIALENNATETQSGGGGNGVMGHDETSEQTNVTWDSSAFTAPTPGAVPPALVP
jgi:uncharacterized protein